MFQQDIKIGNLAADPELRYTNEGKAVANFRLATKEYGGNTEWHNIVLWGQAAEFAGKYAKKGSLAMAVGRSKTRSWEDKDGNKRYTTEVHCNEFKLLGKREEEEADGF